MTVVGDRPAIGSRTEGILFFNFSEQDRVGTQHLVQPCGRVVLAIYCQRNRVRRRLIDDNGGKG